jgi:hypothetical protein
VRRFSSIKKATSYCGLCGAENTSANIVKRIPLSKQRNKHPQLQVDIMPVFLGSGLRSFDGSSLERVRLEKINAQEVGARTSIRFRMKQ